MDLLAILTNYFHGKVIDDETKKKAHEELDLAFEYMEKAAKIKG